MAEDPTGAEGPDWPVSERLIPLSALNHFSYCPRRCALIHIDGQFVENIHTQRGRREHEHADRPTDLAKAGGGRQATGLVVWSDRLGLIGRCDLVEFGTDGEPCPIEFKHGRRRRWANDDLQLCGQALCLEEMLGRPVPRGAVFHRQSNRRREVAIDAGLRAATLRAVTAVRSLLAAGTLPPPVFDQRCGECSMQPVCLPQVDGRLGRPRDRLFIPLPEPESDPS